MPASAYRFGPFVLDRSEFQLRRDTRTVDLPPKALDLLLLLLERPGALLTKEELFQTVWPDVTVTDNALTQVVSEIRQALGDSPASPTYLQTVARKGYRFIGQVETVVAEPSAAAPGPAASADTQRSNRPALAVIDFTNVSDDPSLAWLSAGVAETVLGDLNNLGCFRIIDRARVRESRDSMMARSSAAPLEIARDIQANLVVTGSFQRSGDRLRLAARLIDVATGEVRADAKADGLLEDVFQMQDGIARQFGERLGVPPPAAMSRARQTSNFDAYRAAVEGRLLLESLKAEAVPTALAHFQRAIELDPGFAPAYVGLANARCQLFERARFSPDRPAGMLSQALEDVKRAVELDAGYAEAHATMAFILTSAGHREEARRAARTAVAIEPNHWMHHFRLGYATWGSERLVSLERALSLYADFPFAHFQIAMVHVARGALALAASALRDGLAAQGRLTGSSRRFPAHGLHWLVGVIALARGDGEGALDAFDAERAGGGSEVYGSEFALAACWGCGYALLKLNRREDASREFEACLTADLSGRAALGFATAQSGNGRSVQKALGAVASLVAGMRAAGRESEARLLEAGEHAVRSQKQQALTSIEQALGAAPPGPFGWLLPIDPVFSSLRDLPKFRTAVQAVAARAA